LIIKKPNFFIIGAPKCGTTSLAKWLDYHPNIFFSNPKEPAFFNSDHFGGIRSEKEYLKLFRNSNSNHLAIGEGTTHYIYSKYAIKNILKFQQDAKFIICLRNPIDTALSMHSERVFQGEEPEKSFEKAWKLEKDREKGIGIPLSMSSNPELIQYGKLCKFSYWIDQIYKKVKRNHILILLLDDLKENPSNAFNKVLDFLNVKEKINIQFEKFNTAKQVRSIYISRFIHFSIYLKRKLLGNFKTSIAAFLRNLNTYNRKNKKMSDKLRKEMLEFFNDDILRLESLIGRKLDNWKK